MPSVHRWWQDRPRERYWLEVTDRPDIGVNLKAPKANETGKEFWGYSFLHEVAEGDVIFHYDKKVQAITSRSTATGKPWSDLITWAARGTYARAAGVEPHLREGQYLGLERHTRLETPVTLDEIRKADMSINRELAELEASVSGPLYYPFERSSKRNTRPLQGYLFKLPAFLLELFPSLRGSETTYQPADIRKSLGGDYRRASETQAVAQRDPFAVDPAIVERGLKGHARTQNELADALVAAGFTPRSSDRLEPSFDLSWTDGSRIWVAEVKSLTNANEEKQLRLGLGQVLRYAHLLCRLHRMTVRSVLVAEREPSRSDWVELCNEHQVLLLWPPFEGKIPM